MVHLGLLIILFVILNSKQIVIDLRINTKSSNSYSRMVLQSLEMIETLIIN